MALVTTTKIGVFFMRRIWLLVCGIALTVTACTSGSTTPETVTVTATPISEEAATTEPTNDILSSQFHPCEVLTQEQFEKAGLGVLIVEDAYLGSTGLGCSFGKADREDASGTWLISTDQVNRQFVENQDLETLDWGSAENPDLYVHQMSKTSRQCEAAVDYDWGRFTVNYLESGEGWEPEILCADAVDILENLIKELRGIP